MDLFEAGDVARLGGWQEDYIIIHFVDKTNSYIFAC